MRHVLGRLRFLTWPVVFLCLFVGGGGGALLGILSIPRNPITVQGVREVDGVAQRGGWLDLAFTLTRRQECRAHVERWLWQWMQVSGQRVRRWVQVDATGANPPTALDVMETYVLSVPIPGGVEAGAWFYWSRTRDTCAWTSWLFGENIRESADIPVTIVDPSGTSPVQVVTQPAPVLILPDGAKP